MTSLKRIINTILDTTPRQWIITLAFTFGVDFKSWPDFFNFLVTSSKSFSARTFYASTLTHIILLFAAVVISGAKPLMGSSAEASKLSEQATATFKQKIEQGELIEITGVYYIDAQYLKASRENKGLSTLLARLKKSNNSPWSKNKTRLNSKNKNSYNFKDMKNVKLDWSKPSSKESSNNDSEQILNKHLAKYNGQFKACYEKALIKDSSLSAKIEFLLKVGPNRRISESKINFIGVGVPEVKLQLKNCLTQVTRKIILPERSEKLQGKQLKFFVVLDSWK